MWTVAIETSGREGSIALLRDDELLSSRSLSQEGRRHARTLVHELKALLDESQLAPAECDVLAVSRGPGSFTGLRVGVVCAKTWAFATGCRLVGVDTLQAVAAAAPADVHQVDVVADAQRGDVYWGQYVRDGEGRFVTETAVQIISANVWVGSLTDEQVVSGPALSSLQDRLPAEVRQLPESLWRPSAVEVGRIGLQLAMASQTVSPWELTPLYLRRSAAEENADAADK